MNNAPKRPFRHLVERSLSAFLLVAFGFIAGAATVRVTGLDAPPGPGFRVFWQAWGLVQQSYADRFAVDSTKMTYGAIQGMLDSLGDTGHTRFLSPADLKAEQDALAGKLQGIGAQMDLRDGHAVVVAPLPNSPAQAAGLLPGDVILKVDGVDITNLQLDGLVNRVRGPAGTSVTLTVQHRDGGEPVDITVTRQEIHVPSVTWARLADTPVAQIFVNQFSEETDDELRSALADARSGGATAVILDLRNDPGGLRDQAIAVASEFIDQGNVLIEVDGGGQRQPYPVQPGGTAIDLPLVVLINDGTASSAEIVAGALDDHERATLVGTTSYGTGTVLSLYPLTDGSAILLGTSQWLTPNGQQIWHHGIAPDIPVALPPNVQPLTPPADNDTSADEIQASQDTQLQRALALLTQP
jgi:carboxyl-terminal processing protease